MPRTTSRAARPQVCFSRSPPWRRKKNAPATPLTIKLLSLPRVFRPNVRTAGRPCRAKPADHFVLPLNRQRRRTKDAHGLDVLAELQFFDGQPGHAGFASAEIVREKEAMARLRQDLLIHSFGLVQQRANTRKADGELPVVREGEPDARGFNQQAKLLRGGHRRLRGACVIIETDQTSLRISNSTCR